MAEILEGKGAHVSTATFAILHTCLPKYKPTYWCKEVGLKEYEDISNTISDYVSLLDVPVETDHIQVDGSIEPKMPYKVLEKSLQSLGEIYEGLDSPTGWQLALRRPTFSRPDSLKLPFIAEGIFTHKIRIKYRKNGDISVLPLSFPILQESEEICDGQPVIEFCKKIWLHFQEHSAWEDVAVLLLRYLQLYNRPSNKILHGLEENLEERRICLQTQKGQLRRCQIHL